jgi:RNA polymerase sigma factor (sigma-70 family)
MMAGFVGDERLARLVAGGSQRAFATLYDRYHQPLYRYCRSILRNDADAQDALQSAFASALLALQRGRLDAPVRPWLFRIAHNEAISLARRRRYWEELGDDGDPDRCAVSAEDRAAQRERLALLVADIRELPERQRGALVMRELSGLSHADIAIALEISVGAAKQAIFEARGALADFAEGRAMACEEVRRMVSDGDRRVLRGRRVRAHLHDCTACAAFAAAIPARRADLQALVPPLAPVAAASLLARLTAAGSVHGSGGAGAGGAATVAAGKIAGAGVATKALVGVAVLAGTAAGVTSTLNTAGHHLRRSPRTPPAASVHSRAGGAASPAGSPAAPGARGTELDSRRGAIHRSAAQSGASAKGSLTGEAGAAPTGRGFAGSHGSGGGLGGARVRRGAGSRSKRQAHTLRPRPSKAGQAPGKGRSNAPPAKAPIHAGARHTTAGANSANPPAPASSTGEALSTAPAP